MNSFVVRLRDTTPPELAELPAESLIHEQHEVFAIKGDLGGIYDDRTGGIHYGLTIQLTPDTIESVKRMTGKNTVNVSTIVDDETEGFIIISIS